MCLVNHTVHGWMGLLHPHHVYFISVLSKNIQALTLTLQLGCGQLRKELPLRRGLRLGVTPSPPKEKEVPNTQRSLHPLLGTPPLLSSGQFFSLNIDTHTHEHTCTHRCIQAHTGTHMHTQICTYVRAPPTHTHTFTHTALAQRTK